VAGEAAVGCMEVHELQRRQLLGEEQQLQFVAANRIIAGPWVAKGVIGIAARQRGLGVVAAKRCREAAGQRVGCQAATKGAGRSRLGSRKLG
jgi:hypothetical protein